MNGEMGGGARRNKTGPHKGSSGVEFTEAVEHDFKPFADFLWRRGHQATVAQLPIIQDQSRQGYISLTRG